MSTPAMDPSSFPHSFPTNYFASRKPSRWGLASFVDEFTKQHPTSRPGEANSHFLDALGYIADNPPSRTALCRAQSLIDSIQAKSLKPQGQRRTRVYFINGHRNLTSRAISERISHDNTDYILGDNSEHISSGNSENILSSVAPAPGRSGVVEQCASGQSQDQHVEAAVDRDGNAGKSLPITGNHFLQAFLVVFSAMQKSGKRRFKSGRILEDIIHTHVVSDPATAGSAIYWIIDPTDKAVRSWFLEPELSELRAWTPPTPKVDDIFIHARSRYDNLSAILDLREVAESKPTPPGTRYDRGHNFNATYVNTAVTAILSVIEQSTTNESFGSPQTHREGWYGSKVWSVLLDHCLDDIDNFTVSRTDIASRVGCPGRRFDAVFLAGGIGVEPVEVGAVEVARSGDVVGTRKVARDEGKLREVMAAMLTALLRHVDYDVDTSKLLQVVGVQHVGFNIRISAMSSVSPGVFVLQPGRWRQVPHMRKNFSAVFDVMQSVVIMKGIVRRTVELLRAYAAKKKGV